MMDVRLPNGHILTNVPDGTPKAEIVRKLRRNGKIDTATAAEWLGVQPKPEADYRKELDEGLSTGEQLLIGTGRGLLDVWEGAQQLLMPVGEFLDIVSPEEAQRWNQNVQAERDLYAEGDLGAAGTTGRITGNVAGTAVPVGGLAKAGQATRLGKNLAQALRSSRLTRAGSATIAGAGGGASQYVEEGDSRGTNTLIGMGAGLIAGPLIEKVGRSFSNALRRYRHGMQSSQQARLTAARQALKDELAIPEADVDQVARDIADGLTPEQALRKYEIEQMGATPTRGRVSGDIDDLRAEVEGARFSGELADIEQGNRRAIAETAQERVARMSGGRSTDPYAAGEASRETLAGGRQTARSVEGAAYDEAGERVAQLGDDVRITPSRIAEVVDEDSVNFGLNELSPVVRTLRKFGVLDADDEIIEGATLSPQQAENLRKALGRVSAKGEAKYTVRRLREALGDDVQRDVGEDVFAEARKISAERFATFDNQAKVKAVIDGKIAPEQVVPRLTRASFSADEAGQFFKTLDEVDPQTAMQMRGAVMDDLFGSLKGTTDADEVATITARTFEKRLDAVGDEKLRRIFGDEGAKGLRQIARVSKQLTGIDARVKNPGTAAEVENRLRQAIGAVLDFVPGASLIRGLRNVAKSGKMSRERQRMLNRALNLELLKRENVLQELTRGPHAGVPAAIGAGAAAANVSGE